MSKVYLIGAGPGDAELITLKAVRVLEKCTAVLYDRLANGSLLGYVKDDCEVFYCGKEPGCHYKTQEEINDMLVKLAKAGHTVGRIKGGDPFVFGRGGEEALRLVEEEIDFEVIPGITSAISVPNYAGIPVTHRGIAQSFHVFTGMSANKLNFNWEAIAKIEGTLIFLMGLENIESIVKNLIENGKSENTPCAVIMRGTTSKQKKVTGELNNIAERVIAAGLKSPCIILIGEVVNLNSSLDWYEKKPLSGLNVCITRSKEQSGEIREKLYDMGAQVTEINTIRVKDTSNNLGEVHNKIAEYQYIVFTSVNGVKMFFNYLISREFDIRKIKASFAAIGEATAHEIKKYGIIPEIIAETFVAEGLFDKMKDYVKAGDRILLPRSKSARPYLKDALLNEGCLVDEVFTYDIEEGRLPGSESFEDVDVVVFTSPSTVKNLISMVGVEKIREKKCISIGPITMKELDRNNISSLVCDEYSINGVMNKLLEIRR